MNIPKLIEELRQDEGVKQFPYMCTSGKLTIGVGRNLQDVGLSPDEMDYLLANDISRAIHTTSSSIDFFEELNEARQRALTNMAFQMGISGLLTFKKMIKAMRHGNFEIAATECLDSEYSRQTPARAARIAETIRSGQ